MRRIDVVIRPRGARLSVEVPQTRRERMRGLLGRDRLPPGRGLLLERTRSIHTVGMRLPIAVAFLAPDGTVVGLRRARPWRILLPRLGARDVLECSIAEDIRTGDRLERLRSWKA